MIGIDHVIQQVDAGGSRRERDSRERGVQNTLLVSILMGSKQRNEDQEVLDPLMWPQCLEQRPPGLRTIGTDNLNRIG